MTGNYGAEVATRTETLDGEWKLNGETYDLVVEDITVGTLETIQEYAQVVNGLQTGDATVDDAEELPDLPWEDDPETDFVVSVVTEKLRKPDVDPEDTNPRALAALLEGMMTTWQGGEDLENAREQMPIEGNR